MKKKKKFLRVFEKCGAHGVGFTLLNELKEIKRQCPRHWLLNLDFAVEITCNVMKKSRLLKF